MSQLSDELNRQLKSPDNIWAKSSMACAFDLPFTANNLLAIVGRTIGENNSPFNISLSVEGETMILGFENPKSGNRLIVSFPIDGMDLPDWLLDTSIVTGTTSHLDLTRGVYGGTLIGNGMVVIVSLDGLWITAEDANSWVLNSIEHETSGVNSSASLGGQATYNTDGRYEANCLAKVTYKTVTMGKSVLNKAGRTKPQGDLIVYFAKESCAIEGHNATGTTTLEFQAAGGPRQLDSYESNLDDEIVAVKFGYPQLFHTLFAKRKGVMYNAPAGKLSYGVSDTTKPVIEFDFTEIQDPQDPVNELDRCVLTFVYEDGESIADIDKEMPSMKKAKRAQKRTKAKPKVTVDIEVDLEKYPTKHREMIKEWFDCHVAEQTSRGNVPSDTIGKWFLSYLMKCALDGTEVSEEARSVFNKVKSL